MRLAQALMASTRTRLTELWLECVEMGDLGMAELANLIRQDRCRSLMRLTISDRHITDEGVLALAEAIGQGPPGSNLGGSQAFPLTSGAIYKCWHCGLGLCFFT